MDDIAIALTLDASGRIARETSTNPSSYIIDANGRIAWAWLGATTYGQLGLAVTEAAGP